MTVLSILCLALPASSRERAGNVLSPLDDSRLAQAQFRTTPLELYHKAWKLAQDCYFDQNFNGQNWKNWEHRYDTKIKTSDDAYKCIETMLWSLGEPYTRFLSPEAFDEERSQIQGNFCGVGMQLGMNSTGKVVVIAPLEGSPAYRAGIRPGDEVNEVDGSSVKGQSLDSVVKRIRGPKDTQVSVVFLREGQRLPIKLTRAEIPLKAVSRQEILPGNLGYIRLDSFISQKASDEMKAALEKTATADGLIIDLRNNPGGLLSNGIEVANMFLTKGVIVSTVDASNERRPMMAEGRPISDKPLVVIVNGGSASASEILASALHDNGRCKLVGEKTFGKGLVQAVSKLPEGSGMNITIAKYVTPTNEDINKKGVKPDYVIPLSKDDVTRGLGPWWIDPTFTRFNPTPNDGRDLQLLKACRVLTNQIAQSSGKSPLPDDDEQVRKSVLSKLPPAKGEEQVASSKGSAKDGEQVATTAGAGAPQGDVVKDKWALIIGISKFQRSEYNLKYAAKDATDFRNFLVNDANFAPDHVKLITDEQATQRAIMSAFGDQWLPRVTRPGDLVVIYISTHGTPSSRDQGKQNYLVAYDTDRDDLFATGIPMDLLNDRIKKSVKTDRALIVMDTCYSGFAAGAARGAEQPANFNVDEIAQGTGHLVISSSGTDQRSWESKNYQNGIFTHYLMEALKQKDRRIDVKSAFSYLKEKVEWETQRDYGQVQEPQIGGKWEGAELILTVRAAQPRPLGAPATTANPAAATPSRTATPRR